MKKLAYIVLFAFVAMSCVALQFQVPLGSRDSSGDSKPKRVTSRTLTGLVLDKSDHPVPNAVVYLKNAKTLAVKSFFAEKDGSYRFPDLVLHVDYDVYAEKDGKKSDGKTLSQFDDRASPKINLRIDMNK
jgi:hypothetical protein